MDGCSDYNADGTLRGYQKGRGGGGRGGGRGKGGGGGCKKAGGGKGGANLGFTRVVPKFLSGYAEMLTGKMGRHRPPPEDPDAPTVVNPEKSGMASIPDKYKDEEQTNEGADEWDEVEMAALEEYEEKHATKKNGSQEKMLQKIREKAKKRKIIELTKKREEENQKEEDSGKHSFRVTKKSKVRMDEKEQRKKWREEELAGGHDEGVEKKKKKKKKKKANANLLSFAGDEDL